GTLTLLGLIGTNHSDTPPVSISSGSRIKKIIRPANHNGRIAPAAVVTENTQSKKPGKLHDCVQYIIQETISLCQPLIFLGSGLFPTLHGHLINGTALAKKNGICYNKLIFYR
ncbi:MAG: hypothetical protein Q4G56_03050, partial [Bacillota bacterium]|nr:hypothetical protein [Bacillota bacterium]